MHQSTAFRAVALSTVLMAGATFPVSSAEGRDPATISGIEGKVETRTASSPSWRHAALQSRLNPGDAIKTGSGSRAEITYADGSITRIAPTTTLRLTQKAEGSRIKVVLGSIWLKMTKGRSLKVETPTATATIVGTEFLVDALDDGRSHVSVLEGAVSVEGNQGDKVQVDVGNWVEIYPGKPMEPPSPFNIDEIRRNLPVLQPLNNSRTASHDDEEDTWP
jgi:hypothetical protein